MKKTIIFLLVISVALLFTSCGDVEYGKINDVDIELSERTSEPAPPSQFTGTEDTLGYKYETVNVGRAYMQIPYPSTWKMQKETDYDIKFIAPENDKHFPNTCVYFHSTLENTGYIEQEYMMEMFANQITGDKYYYGGNYVKMAPSSKVEDFIVDTTVSKAEYDNQLSYRDWDANIIGKTPRNTAKEKPYYQKTLYTWYGFPCIMSGLVEGNKADELFDLIVYMMSNTNYINDSIKETRNVTVFEKSSNICFPISTLYEGYAATKGPFDKAAHFTCSPNSGTGYSHSSISLYEIKKKKFKGIESDTFDSLYLDTFLENQFGVDGSSINVHGYMDENMTGSVTFGNKKTNEFVYRFLFETTNDQIEGTFVGQQWMIVMYPIELDNKIILLTLTTPESGLIWSFDSIELIAKYITYGK